MSVPWDHVHTGGGAEPGWAQKAACCGLLLRPDPPPHPIQNFAPPQPSLVVGPLTHAPPCPRHFREEEGQAGQPPRCRHFQMPQPPSFPQASPLDTKLTCCKWPRSWRNRGPSLATTPPAPSPSYSRGQITWKESWAGTGGFMKDPPPMFPAISRVVGGSLELLQSCGWIQRAAPQG